MTATDPVRRTAESVEDYIASHDPDGSLARLDELVSGQLPGATRALWRGVFWGGTEQAIIGYDEIVQPRSRGPAVSWFLVGLARQKAHVSVYVNAAEDGRYLSQLYAERLGRVKVGSAAITFRTADDVDLAVLAEVVRRAAQTRNT